ncbi:MAG: hypothetical protein HQK51_07480 [Oligoflexia bacterium]|nr:hypothetical protein [Oligoflexia bacterium]
MELFSKKDRVHDNTHPAVNRKIKIQTDASIEYYGRHPELIPERLKELDKEWDIERILEANASIFIILGLLTGIFVKKRLRLFPLIVSSFLLQHSIQGWCPPLPILRRLGVRTTEEILREKAALSLLNTDNTFVEKISKKDISAEERLQTVVRNI